MLKTISCLAATAFMLASTAASATVWAPTNNDVDFIQWDLLGLSTDGGTLAMFDNGDLGGTALVIGTDGGHVEFTASGSDYIAELFDVNNVKGGSILLSGDSNFELGMDYGQGYITDTSWAAVSSPDTYLVVFAGKDGSGNKIFGNTLAVDVQAVPVPAAVWLFGSGLIGLVGVARRRA